MSTHLVIGYWRGARLRSWSLAAVRAVSRWVVCVKVGMKAGKGLILNDSGLKMSAREEWRLVQG